MQIITCMIRQSKKNREFLGVIDNSFGVFDSFITTLARLWRVCGAFGAFVAH